MVDRLTVISGGLLEKNRNGRLSLCHETLGAYITHSANLDFSAEDTATNLGHRYFVGACCQACTMIDTPIIHKDFVRRHGSILGYTAFNSFYHAVESGSQLTLLRALSQSPLRLWNEVGPSPLRYFMYYYPDQMLQSVMKLRFNQGQLISPAGGVAEIEQNIKGFPRPDEIWSWSCSLSDCVSTGNETSVRYILDHYEELLISMPDIFRVWSSVRRPGGPTVRIIYEFMAARPPYALVDLYLADRESSFRRLEGAEEHNQLLTEYTLTRENIGSLLKRFLRKLQELRTRDRCLWHCYLDCRVVKWVCTTQAFQVHPLRQRWLSLMFQVAMNTLRFLHGWRDGLEDFPAVEEQLLDMISYFLSMGAKVDIVSRARARGLGKIWSIIKDQPFDKSPLKCFMLLRECGYMCPNNGCCFDGWEEE